MDNEMMKWMKPFEKTFDQDFFKSFQHLFNQNQQNHHNLKVNLYEGINELLCVIFLPGVDNVENISLNVVGKGIEISGTLDIQFDNFKLIQKEFDNGEFSRLIELPYFVREDKVEARYKQGLLIVHLYKLLSNSKNENRISIQHIDE